MLATLCVAGYYIHNYFTTPVSIKYKQFGIEIPVNYPIHGIDVSRYQQLIDWEDVKAMEVNNISITFAYIKATEGINMVDAQFRRNWIEAGEQDIIKGAYHYFIAGKSGKLQAKNFLEIVDLDKGDLPPVIDVEEANGADPKEIEDELGEWLKIVEKNYNVKPIIYCNIEFYTRYIKEKFSDYPVWIAHYLQPVKPRLEEQWLFWQHSDKGRVDGIKTPVDFNVFYGDSLDFQNLLIK